MKQELKYIIENSSSAGMVRRAASLIAIELGFNVTIQGQISIVINELCSNILKHANRGEVILVKNTEGISILAIDNGPGMFDVDQCLADGFSTTGTAGNGLGAVMRMSSHFDIHSQVHKGTVVLSAFYLVTPRINNFSCNGFSLPIHGEVISGDDWCFKVNQSLNSFQILVSDGLGHGIAANRASVTAVRAFAATADPDPLKAVATIHHSMKSTQGAAVAVAYFDLGKKILNYCGLGNISGTIVSPTKKRKLLTFNGTAGLVMPHTMSVPYEMDTKDILILHSDGLKTEWNLAGYQNIYNKDPLIIAGVLYRDYNRNSDDVSVVVAKVRS